MKSFLYTSIGIIFLLACVFLFLRNPAPGQNAAVTIGDKIIRVEVADTEALRDQGLGDRESLAPGYGMLFVFDTPSRPGFWMKDMKFPIDIVWIDENGEVVGVERSVSPDSYPRVFYPVENVKYVLETKADSGIDTGSHASFNL
jgi:uncharacterized protein